MKNKETEKILIKFLAVFAHDNPKLSKKKKGLISLVKSLLRKEIKKCQ
jgi:hypothetical protein